MAAVGWPSDCVREKGGGCALYQVVFADTLDEDLRPRTVEWGDQCGIAATKLDFKLWEQCRVRLTGKSHWLG